MFWHDFRSPFWVDFDFSSFFFPEGLFLNPRCSQCRAPLHSRRHSKDDRMKSPRIILNHTVDLVTKDDLPG